MALALVENKLMFDIAVTVETMDDTATGTTISIIEQIMLYLTSYVFTFLALVTQPLMIMSPRHSPLHFWLGQLQIFL